MTITVIKPFRSDDKFKKLLKILPNNQIQMKKIAKSGELNYTTLILQQLSQEGGPLVFSKSSQY